MVLEDKILNKKSYLVDKNNLDYSLNMNRKYFTDSYDGGENSKMSFILEHVDFFSFFKQYKLNLRKYFIKK